MTDCRYGLSLPPHWQPPEDGNSYPAGLAFINPGAQLRDLMGNISDLGKYIHSCGFFSVAQTLSSRFSYPPSLIKLSQENIAGQADEASLPGGKKSSLCHVTLTDKCWKTDLPPLPLQTFVLRPCLFLHGSNARRCEPDAGLTV